MPGTMSSVMRPAGRGRRGTPWVGYGAMPPPVTGCGYALLESGSHILLESGKGDITFECPPRVIQSFRVALIAKLDSISDLTGIVGSAIYPTAIPETHDLADAGPALTYVIPTNPRGHVLTGSDGTSAARVTLSAWGYSLADVDAITAAVWNALDGIPGAWGDGSCVIMSVSHQDETDDHIPPRAGTDQWIYRISSDYRVQYRTGLPTLQ